MAKSPHLSRQDFVKFTAGVLGSIMGAIVGLPAIGYLLSPALKTTKLDAWVSLGPLENYPIGVPTPFSFTRSKVNGWEKTVNSYGVFILRKSESEVVVFSNVCTHLSCRVAWKEDIQQYYCPCHDAHFGINGEIISGPQPRPLDRYETRLEGGNLSIRLLEG
ncbi:MAG: Rieske (2Fe-2S) protein [Anaerolineales bacterium]|nr:Rieske (2Fe-2S) protein [Anaerolineales bacterium]